MKPLECLVFLRNVNSASYFDQMKGRGCRIIGSDDLRAVTPDAKNKTHYVIVDAVGVCENDKTTSKPLDRKPSVSLEKLLQMVAQGMVHEDIVSTLATRLARLPENRHERKETWSPDNPEGRWRRFSYEDLIKRDRVNLDITWLKDKTLEDDEDLSSPEVIAAEIVEDLQTALEQFSAIAAELEKR